MATASKGSKGKGGSVRFAPAQPPEGAHGHVHFEEQLHDSAVMVTPEGDGSFLVKVGFLRILHKYEITFLLPLRSLGRAPSALPLPTLNLRVTAITPLPEDLHQSPADCCGVASVWDVGGYSVKCEYTAHKEGVLKEEMVLVSEAGEGATIRVVVQARVMDRHHGTPMLLDGVRCIGAELEYDSEQSDWHGFD
ncbi:adipose-secreted signaling protein isoform 1-T2 [Amazona ochrocephala]